MQGAAPQTPQQLICLAIKLPLLSIQPNEVDHDQRGSVYQQSGRVSSGGPATKGTAPFSLLLDIS